MNDNSMKFLITDEHVKFRLDVFLANQINNCTRSNIKKIIDAKNVKINNSIILTPSKKLKLNDTIIVNFKDESEPKLKPYNKKLNIVFEDNDILVVNKPAGMVVHPGAGNKEKTLVNALLFKYKSKLSNINGISRPGIVHRIDKNTSGLLVVAKNNLSHSKLGQQFNDHSIKRKYLALIWGVIRPLNGKIETLISRSKKNRQLMTVSELSGKKAITNYKTKKVFNIKDIPKISLLECKLETGRTHQIRVHMSYKKTPLLGDKQYGKKNIRFKKINKEFENSLNFLDRQALHAQSLGFIHPTKKIMMNFESELPKDYKKLLNLLKKLSS